MAQSASDMRERTSPSSLHFYFLLFLIVLCYSNTLHVPWLLDDYANILDNKHVHLEKFSRDSIYQTFFADIYKSDKAGIYRPVACFTFGLNWFFGGDNVAGYHIVNIAIHVLTAFFLYLFLLELFNSPNLKTRQYGGHIRFISLLTAVLWAVNPIQIQAITYIVQRMTSLAGLFYIAGMYAYLKLRNTRLRWQKILFALLCILSVLLSVGSKENAITFPSALLLIEFVFYAKTSVKHINYRNIFIFLGCSILFSLLITLLLLKSLDMKALSFIKDFYAFRPFTMTERILTQFRVLLFYLSQIFYPVPSRFSIMHGMPLSESLFVPLTTIPAILIVIGLIISALALIRRMPCLSFSILFFFLAHVVESSILPLENIFEHRNYVPSMFLFLPAAIGTQYLIYQYQPDSKLLRPLLVFFVISLIFFSGLSTYMRNHVWRSEFSLWSDTHKKYPNMRRPYMILGRILSENDHYPQALRYFNRALDIDLIAQNVKKEMKQIYFNIASNCVKMKDYKKAVFYRKKSNLFNNNIMADDMETIVLDLVSAKAYDEAIKAFETAVLKPDPVSLETETISGIAYIQTGQTDKAINILKKALKRDPDNLTANLNLGIAWSQWKEYQKSERILVHTSESIKNTLPLIWLLQISIESDQADKANYYADQLLLNFALAEIDEYLDFDDKSGEIIPPDIEAVSSFLGDIMMESDY